MKDQEYLMREEKNKALYDELTEKYNLYDSLTSPEHNNTINPDAMWAVDEITKLRGYVLGGIDATNKPVLTEQGVYIEYNNVEDFQNRMKKLAELEAQIKDKIPGIEARKASLVKPDFNVEEEIRKLDEVPVKDEDNYKEYQRQRQNFINAINTSTYDERRKLEKDLLEADYRWYGRQSKRLNEVKAREEKIQQEINAYGASYRAAKERYNRLSLWGKLKAKIQKQDAKHLNGLSKEELDSMYVSNGRSR